MDVVAKWKSKSRDWGFILGRFFSFLFEISFPSDLFFPHITLPKFSLVLPFFFSLVLTNLDTFDLDFVL